MATWHQNRRPVRLYHDTKWTIITDPPNGMRTLMLFDTKERAEEILALWKATSRGQHSYILKPGSHKGEQS